MSRGLIVDLFAGGGGASLGLEMALGRAVDVAVNHNPEAVAIHAANHPGTRHFVQNICNVHPLDATGGRPVDVLWASPDCKHFSKAKGTAPKARNIRELAWAVVHWVRYSKPKLVIVENVEEFQGWGPIDGEGMPIKAKAGETFRRWLKALARLGYRVDFQLLRACDYGAPTIRRRLFIVARRDGQVVAWPEPTHGPGRPQPWRAAADCIDWSIPAPSIFDRPKPLVDNTLRRIAEGLRRFVIETDKPFIVKPEQVAARLAPLNIEIGGNDRNACPSPANQPFKTLLCREHKALVAADLVPFIQHMQHGGRGRAGVLPADEPLRTITAYPKGGGMALAAAFLAKANHTADYYQCFRGQGLHAPLQTVTQSPGFSLVQASLAPFIVGAGGPRYGGKPVSLQKPMGTLTAENHKALALAYLIHFYGAMQDGRLGLPLKTVTSGGLHSGLVTAFLVNCHFFNTGSALWEPSRTATAVNNIYLAAAFLNKYYGTAVAESLDDPLSTVTGRPKLALTAAFLAKYYGHGNCQGLAGPLGTVTTRDRYGLVLVHFVPLVWVEGEPYVIADIGLRMLTPRELARAQGFPEGYKFDPLVNGKPLSQKAQVAAIGNSVPPAFSHAIVKANIDALDYEEAPADEPIDDLFSTRLDYADDHPSFNSPAAQAGGGFSEAAADFSPAVGDGGR